MESTLFLNFNIRKGNYQLTEIFKDIKDCKYENQISLLRNANDVRKTSIKKNLPAFTPSLVLNSGRKFNEGDSYNGIIHLDYDKLDEIGNVIEKIKSIEFTYSCFVSPSGNGIKVFVRVSNKMEQHKDAFNTLRNYYDKAVGIESDKSVKDPNRLCFVSSDPELYLNEKSKVFDFTTISMTRTPEELWEYTSRKQTFTLGNRNNFIFSFACNTNREGLNIEEVISYCSSMTNATLTYQEIESTIKSAYENNTSQFAEMQSVQSMQFGSKEDKSPMIPDEVYENLPGTLKESCYVFSGRERDVYLTSALSVISGGLSNVQGLYSQNIVYPNLFSFIIAPAASGKGSMNYAQSLGNCYQSILETKNLEAKARYQKDLEVYNFKKRNAKNEEAIRSLEKPEEPKFKTFFIPGNTSSAMIYKHLQFNEGSGCISETETDTLTNALKQEWGGFSDVLRKAFHHETISLSRRTDLEYSKIEEPKFSLSITGTPDQIKSILSSTQNGLASRFMFYTFNTPPKWRTTYTQNITQSKQNKFLNFTQDLCDKFTTERTRYFNLTASQGNKLDESFENLLDEKYYSHLGDSGSLVIRLGLITYKIAMVLSALRSDKDLVECKDIDFKIAMQLSKVYLTHGLNIFEKISNRENKLPLNDEIWINKLDKEFTTKEAITVAESLGIKERSAYKKLKAYSNNGYLMKIEIGKYQKK